MGSLILMARVEGSVIHAGERIQMWSLILMARPFSETYMFGIILISSYQFYISDKFLMII
jgi:hypothetical protein